MNYLSAAELLAIHELLINDFGGMRGITETGFGRLEGAVAAPQLSAFGEDLFPDVPSKAAALCAAIVHAHPFSDGNKRVGLVALDVLLTRNGYTLTATNDEAYDAIITLAQRGLDRDAFIAWVRQHIQVGSDGAAPGPADTGYGLPASG
ncbi:MAG: type II toxin-antitoxin system death-on-curing family toxin [Roseiflexaceae bacterium]